MTSPNANRSTPLTHLAEALCTWAHRGQKRAGSDKPYAWHPIRVADIVAIGGGSEQAVCAALLHDTLEDTDLHPFVIESLFGPEVRQTVETVTRRDGEAYDDFILRVAEAGGDAVSVKVADLTHNLTDMPPAKAQLRERYENALMELSR